MRVTNNMMLRNTTSNINNNKYSVNSLNNQMSSQKKISRPSEDPVVAIRALRLRSNLSEKVILIMQEEPFLPGIARTVN